MKDSMGLNKSNAFKISAKYSALVLALALGGCGGGSDGGVDSIKPGLSDNGGSGSSGGSNNPGSEGSVDAINVSNIVLMDVDGNTTRVINRNGVMAKVTVTDNNGQPVSGALVNFSAEKVVFGSSNNSVITNADGEAIIAVGPESNTDTGSYTMSATATYDQQTASAADIFYSIQAVSVGLTNLQAAKTNLESGDSTLVTVNTIDQSTGAFANDVTVNFSATCGSFDNTSISSSNRGNVSTTYKAIDNNGQLCEGAQIISAATPSGNSSPLQTTVNIASIEATSIVYSTVDGLTLGAKSSGSASSSQIEFTVFSNGTPASNQEVDINLLRAPADFSFIRNGNRESPQTLISDASGKVSVTVYPGDIPGPVELKASLKSDPSVFALSKNVSVATGRPSQNGITLAVDKTVLQNDIISSSTITAYLNDRQGNFVPEGTVVNFVAEGGSITPSCATDEVGKCSVTFTSQNPRPANGRVSVLAYVEGDKAFVDNDGDNSYTAGVDTLTQNIGTLFRDDNENMTHDEGEFQYNREPLGGSAECAIPLFSQPNLDMTCNDDLDAILRQQIIMGFADSVPTIVNLNYDSSSNSITFSMYGNSSQTLPMPSGTSVSIAVEDRTDNNGSDCKAELIGGFEEVPGVIDLERVYSDNGNLINDFLESDILNYTVDVASCSSADKVELNVSAPNSVVIKQRLNPLLPSQ